MIRRICRLFAVLTVLSLSGCALLQSLDDNLDKQVDVWMRQHEYAKILDTLQYVRPSNPKYKLLQKKRQQAVVESKRYEQNQIKKAVDLMERGQWNKAEICLNDAMDKLPESTALQKTYRDFTLAREQELSRLYCQLYSNKAEWLINNRPVQEQLTHTIQDDHEVKRVFSEYGSDVEQVYGELLDCGKQALQQKNTELALKTYRLADRLNPDKSLKPVLSRLQDAIDRKLEDAKASGGRGPALSQLGHNLLEKSKKALAAGDLKNAIIHYDKIPEADKQLPQVVAYNASMNRRIHENVSQGIELGRKLYSQGQVEQALAVWNKLRDIDPDNEDLLNHIDRAERVLEKIKQLRQEQTRDSSTSGSVNGQ